MTPYRDHPGVNPSTLKILARKSPLHYRYALTHPREETPAMRLGTAMHAAILEGDRFASRYVARPEGMKFTTTEGRAWRDAHADFVILDADELDRCLAMRAAVESHPIARRYLSGPGCIETPIVWTDAETGVACKGRPDLILDDGTIVDLKSTRDLNPRKFAAQCADLGYHLSLAMYHDGRLALGYEVPAVIIIAVESAPPHDVVVYRLPEDVIEIGRDDYKRALTRLAECRASDVWPGRAVTQMDLVLPRWSIPGEDSEGASYEVVE
jgi:exodeoxyribonuclease VIII